MPCAMSNGFDQAHAAKLAAQRRRREHRKREKWERMKAAFAAKRA